MGRAALGLFLLLFVLAGCSGVTVVSTPAPTLPGPTVPAVADVLSTPTPPIPTPSIESSSSITLTVWVPEQFAPEAARGGDILERQIEEFMRTHRGVAVTYALKSPHGEGGLLDFMLQVQELVPSRLPDLVVIDSREVDAAARANLLTQLDHDLPAGAFADLLPPAQQTGRYEGENVSLPITLELEHLVYNTKAIKTPPSTWDQVIAAGGPFAFAPNDDAFLFQYLANNGRISTGKQLVPLDVSVTTSVLTFFQRVRAASTISDTITNYKTSQEAWEAFASGQAAMAEVQADDYTAERARVPDAGFAPLPTHDGASTALVSSWNYAIVTTDPRRHAAAAEFLNWIAEPSRAGEWAAATRMIPASRSAFASAVSPPAYGDLLLKLLTGGIVAPSLADRAPYTPGLDAAIQSVLRGQATPGEAALRAATSLAP